jgi:hypothetical protein
MGEMRNAYRILVRKLKERGHVDRTGSTSQPQVAQDGNTTHHTTLNSKNYVIIKSKAVPLHAMEAYGGRGGIAPTHT